MTYGSPRQHIWSFAGGFDEGHSNYLSATCSCITGSTNGNCIPSFVGQNYFCESGITRYSSGFAFWPTGDPLWDGQGCGPTSTCCTFNSPPWFNGHGSMYNCLPQPLMTLRSGSVVIKGLEMKIFQYNSLRHVY